MLRKRPAVCRRPVARIGLITAALACTTLTGKPSYSEKPAAKQICVVVLGDSTTVGYSVKESYPKQLERALTKQGVSARVINASINNDTTQGALRRLKKDVFCHAPDIATVQFRLNDQTMRLYQKPEATTAYVALPDFEKTCKAWFARYAIVVQRRSC